MNPETQPYKLETKKALAVIGFRGHQLTEATERAFSAYARTVQAGANMHARAYHTLANAAHLKALANDGLGGSHPLLTRRQALLAAESEHAKGWQRMEAAQRLNRLAAKRWNDALSTLREGVGSLREALERTDAAAWTLQPPPQR